MTVAVGELIHSLNLESVLDALHRNYQGPGEDEDSYRQMWACLLKMQPRSTKMTVVLRHRWSLDDPPEPWVDVGGDDGTGTIFAIEFVPWQEWLSMPIAVDEKFGAMPEADQLAHCLYEMTFAGYAQETIADQFEDICDLAEEAQKLAGETGEIN